jgi:dipeptidyl aminopeptidase/acylaminoacyl peptidase
MRPPLAPAAIRQEAAIEALDLSADGELVVYASRTVEGDAYRSRLWLVPWSGGRPRPLTAGAAVDHSPAFSPDGATVAFLADRDGGADQVYAIPTAGGEPRRLTDFRRGATALAWTPDGRGLVVSARNERSPLLHGASADAAPTARVVLRLDWRDDDHDGLMLHPVHAHLVPFRPGGTGVPAARRLTAGAWSARSVRVSPDGSEIAFLADQRPDADLEPHPGPHAVPLAGGEPRPLAALPGAAFELAYAADGGVVCVGVERSPAADDDPWLLFAAGRDGAMRALTPTLDRHLDGLARDGRHAIVHDGGRDRIARIDADGALSWLTPAAAAPTTYAIAAAGARVAAAMALDDGAPEIYALEQGGPRRLTRQGSAFLRRHARVEQRELQLPGAGGPISTWLHSPDGAGNEALPTVLLIHGGPTSAYTAEPPLEARLLAARGYRVARPNIRGSWGFGRDWIRALHGDWGGVDAADCHAVLDALVEQGLARPDRLACFGRSYGGFVVNWLVGTSDRFAAAVSECGVANQVAAWGSADCGAVYNAAAGLGDVPLPGGVEALWRTSPLRHVAAIRTPLLLLQGEADLRCPRSDNEQLFVALRWLRREVSYVLYPESTHMYNRNGRPDRRIDRNERILAWIERYAPV